MARGYFTVRENSFVGRFFKGGEDFLMGGTSMEVRILLVRGYCKVRENFLADGYFKGDADFMVGR